MEGGPERTNVSFRPSSSVTNEWTFKMTPGDLTVDLEFTHDFPDPANASLAAVYPSAGSISPDFTKDNFNYTVAVPFGTTEFSISALAENPYLAPEMLPEDGSGYSLLDADLMSAENGGPLPEGPSNYEITLTSEDGSVKKTYNIDVICLPDLSLKTFQITRADKDFARDLASLDQQTVYLPYYEGLTVVAESNDGGASVSVLPSAAVSGLNPIAPASVTVAVSKGLPGVDPKYTAKSYVLNLYYGEGMAPEPLAEGGYVSFMPGESGDVYYEVHTFLAPGESTLSFVDKSMRSVQADYLIVAGGGGAGGSRNQATDCGGGGGAGGLLYKNGETLRLSGGSVSVTVGKGGAGGAVQIRGVSGGTSSIGNVEVIGGGGGGPGSESGRNDVLCGGDGGSGGGGGAGGGTSIGNGGNHNNANGVLGNAGGAGGTDTSGGGGGGAGGEGNGGNDNSNNMSVGGMGWQPSGDSDWIKKVITGVEWFSRGGAGGVLDASKAVPAVTGTKYGDGGAAANSITTPGGKGADGIVIIRFPHTEPSGN
jgi:hypothetical protein